ncbi:glycoside hydrolase N-terminal domain-containing protein [Chitinophagaceae bacterium LB-8]|uniref:Glycoside hydrolase N-terminal domain-containing protein n=1 Tax=Paraflavisolibacter caeni TaxID=2982496 RepID=A0A9X3BA05_9BACT|nr:glycoside hydrolase N-terminal domain-containing protein [Paraflavisolibacter caeni]MCU7552006.1 glycoside hydrolase N-terminal domain-containing protein [Paraflavisolibacter caeni]
MQLLRSAFIILISLFCINTLFAQTQNLKLWYRNPAQKWTDALPIGNGRLGGMIYGGTEEEHIQFNEETLWTGGPRDYHREGASHYLQAIRNLLAEAKQTEAEALAEQHFMGRKSNEEGYESLKNSWFQSVRKDTAASAFSFDEKNWKEIQLPAAEGWETVGLEGEDGAIWLRNSFDLPKEWEGKSLVVELGRIRDLDFTYVNGKAIGSSEGITKNRRYLIPASVLRKGKNVISIQVINWYDKGGLIGIKNFSRGLVVRLENEDISKGISLDSTWKYWIQNNTPPVYPQYEASYQPFGDLFVQFKHSGKESNYSRELDISNAVAKTTYTVNGVTYTREYLASVPHQAIVMRITANKKGSIHLYAFLKSPHKGFTTQRIDDQTIRIDFKVRNGVLRGASYLRVIAINGKETVSNKGINLENADEAIFYLTAATSFKSFKDVSGNPDISSKQPLLLLNKSTNYTAIRAAHQKDYHQLFNKFSINFGRSSNESLPTDERILKFSPESDPSLLTLYMQYARYLLISSSRVGTQPANLQGIWNNLLTPPWGSKYTTNINLQMNYWPAEILNLSSCTEPLFRLIEEASKSGKETAKAHYNASGWVLHHNTDIWRGTAPINASNHGIWVTGAAWLCQHIWEHYQFTQDKNFLQQQYPIMKNAAVFFIDFLVKDPKTGWLISTPSNSPEHGGLVAGPAMDHQIIRELFNNCILASQVLQTDEAFRKQLLDKVNQIAPNQIGRYGQLQEWLEDKDDTTDTHRHVSHLWGVYPGRDITWDDSIPMMKAARQSLLYRGDEGTGWSLAWKVNLWARFKDGNHALQIIKGLLSPAEGASGSERGGVYHNLFDAHPPFQIDGNFGGAAGIGEMLLQSHAGYIDLLPALPVALAEGAIKGLCARNGFEVAMSWKAGQLSKVEVLSKNGNECILRYHDREVKFSTQKGKVYRFDSSLKKAEIAGVLSSS